MPSTRKRKGHTAIELTVHVRTHLELGDCLIPARGGACYCGLRGPGGIENTDLVKIMQARLDAEKLAGGGGS